MSGSKSVHNQGGNKNQNKAYEMIRQAIGYNKDGPTYQNFSNIFSLQGQGSSQIGLAQSIKNMPEAGKRTASYHRGTTSNLTDANTAKNEQILASFKSKILHQMNENLRNTTTDMSYSATTKPGQLEFSDY